MDEYTRIFDTLRPRLEGLAYRMLGSRAEAEDIVQDAWLRWHEAPQASLDSAEGWLVTVTTRLSIDRLRSNKVRRDSYPGMWLPEPMLTESPATPEQVLERADDISVAFLVLLEQLTPEARAAFLLREVFDTDYEDVALMVGKSEASCRQMVHRAKTQLLDKQPRTANTRSLHHGVMRNFAEALVKGDFAALKRMLDDNAQLIGDGGGKVQTFPKPMLGGQRIAQLFYATCLRYKTELRIELALINGEWGLLRFIEGKLESAQTFETDGQRILSINVQRNPDKLARINTAWELQQANARQ
ncbi:RNA polymerase sigma-70 factor [Undibacterium sp.]|uniref:RNA polymerase sigma-70 factor n=1 Tax=Undibacterium sp. TaxID=1914977 RepID=UPI00374CF70C